MKISPDVLDKFQPNLINLEEVKKLFLTENKDIEKIYSYQYFKNNFREFLKY